MVKQNKDLVPQATETNLTVPTDILEDFLAMCQGKAGMENTDVRDIITPHVHLIQSLSPQRKKNHEAYVEGVEEGDFVISSTKEIMKSFKFIFVGSEKSYCEYTFTGGKKDKLVARHKDESVLLNCTRESAGKKGYFTENDNITIPERNSYILIVKEDGSLMRAIIKFKNTSLSSWKALATMMDNQTIMVGDKKVSAKCTFGFVYQADSRIDSRNGDEYFNFAFKDIKKMVNAEQYKAAKEFYTDFKKNLIIEDKDTDIEPEAPQATEVL